MDKTWKRHEREVAKKLGTHRIANSGFGQPDIIYKNFAIEHKSRKGYPSWIKDAIEQAETNAKELDPVTIFTFYGDNKLHKVVMISLELFQRLADNEEKM